MRFSEPLCGLYTGLALALGIRGTAVTGSWRAGPGTFPKRFFVLELGIVGAGHKPYSATIALQPQTHAKLTSKLRDLEPQFKAATGYGFSALTESEARYLANFEPVDTIRNRITQGGEQARPEVDDGADGGLVASNKSQTDTPEFKKVAQKLNTGKSHIYKSTRGRNGGTWVHWRQLLRLNVLNIRGW